jgi:hypothetical protein
MVVIHCECFFVVSECTPILFFYLWSFLPKNPVFVTQIAKICDKVTIFFPTPQIESTISQIESFLSAEWRFISVEFYLANIALFRQILP